MNIELLKKTESFFSKLPPLKSREYEKQIADYTKYFKSEEDITVLKNMMVSGSPYAFEAYFCLCTLYRRRKDFELMRELVYGYPNFKKHIYYNHLLVQYLVHSEAFYDYNELLTLAYRDAQIFDDNAGFLQAFCNAFSTICEYCEPLDRETIVKEWYDSALVCINKAIELDPQYAKFYYTKARIIVLKNRYNEAKTLINKAISLEDSSRDDYSLMFTTYQIAKMSFELRKQKEEVQQEILKLSENSKSARANVSKSKDLGSESIAHTCPMSYNGDDGYVFISYSHLNKDKVYEIIKKMQDTGIRVWYDNAIKAGKEWPEEIGSHLINSKIFVLMLTEESISSANVRREVAVALSKNKKMIILQLDDVMLTPGMELQLSIYQSLKLNNSEMNIFIKDVLDAVGESVKENG